MRAVLRSLTPWLLPLLAAGCASHAGAFAGPPLEPLPPPPLAGGPLAIHVQYPRLVDTGAVPRAEAPIASHDSTFIFGSTGRGDATLTVNGTPVPVYTDGGWIAWLPLPDDSIATFDLVAVAGTDTARYTFVAPIAQRFMPPDSGLWIDTTSLRPAGMRWVRPREGVRFSVRATPGATVLLRLGDSTVVPFLVDTVPVALSAGETAFGRARPASPARQYDRYVAWHVGPVGPDPGDVMVPDTAPDTADARWARLEVIAGGDTLVRRWPLRLGVLDPGHPRVVIVNDDTAHTGRTDSTLAGRGAPHATYYWFFPNGTRAVVNGRWNDQVRLRLARGISAWVDHGDVQPLPPGTPPPGAGGVVESVRLYADTQSVTLRVPLPAHVPFRVDEDTRALHLTLYGVAADVNWIQYGGTDPFVRLIRFAQPAEDRTVLTVDLTKKVWGYRTRWVGNDLLLEIRRPPHIDRTHPLRGRLIALDPGHPPLGATGPTGAYEADVVLAVARKARTLLERAGARILMTRTDTLPVGLVARTEEAERANADILVSIHANALPDGVNPFVNSGTSVYYNHPRAAPLARAIDRALVHQFGVRDLGMGRGDLALARPTWMPAVLVEGLFIMLPDQEADLAGAAGQWRYARAVVDGIRAFLAGRARDP